MALEPCDRLELRGDGGAPRDWWVGDWTRAEGSEKLGGLLAHAREACGTAAGRGGYRRGRAARGRWLRQEEVTLVQLRRAKAGRGRKGG
eukprot:618345-Pleurochrysis_carterae.AAC.1